jgi:hypothetical protein
MLDLLFLQALMGNGIVLSRAEVIGCYKLPASVNDYWLQLLHAFCLYRIGKDKTEKYLLWSELL